MFGKKASEDIVDAVEVKPGHFEPRSGDHLSHIGASPQFAELYMRLSDLNPNLDTRNDPDERALHQFYDAMCSASVGECGP